MQTHSDMQNFCSIRGHSTLPLPSASAQGQFSTLGAPSCSTGSPLMRSIISDGASQDRAICPLSAACSINESGAGYGVFLNREDLQNDIDSSPEPFSYFRPDLLSRSVLISSVDCASACPAEEREAPDVTDGGRVCSNYSTSTSPFLPLFCNSSAPAIYGPLCSTQVSASPGADVREEIPLDSIPRIVPISRAFSNVSVKETEASRSSMGSGLCFKAGLPPEPLAPGPILDRNSDDIISDPASFCYSKDCSIKETFTISPVDKSEEITSEFPAAGAVRNSSRACNLCGTTKTPLWRSGPHGPKSLCNACGIRFKKSRRSLATNECPDQSFSPSSAPKLQARPLKRKFGIASDDVGVNNRNKHALKRSSWPALMVVKRDSRVTSEDTESCLSSPATYCSSRISQKNSLNRKAAVSKLALLVKQSRFTRVFAKDEEEAAILLMALSCGLVLA